MAFPNSQLAEAFASRREPLKKKLLDHNAENLVALKNEHATDFRESGALRNWRAQHRNAVLLTLLHDCLASRQWRVLRAFALTRADLQYLSLRRLALRDDCHRVGVACCEAEPTNRVLGNCSRVSMSLN